MNKVKHFNFPSFFLILLLISGWATAQEPPDIMVNGNVIGQNIETENGTEYFLNNKLTVDGANYVKVFGKTAFNTTLYHDIRRQECYKESLLAASQLPVIIFEESKGIDETLKKIQKFADGSGKFIDFWDARHTNYREAKDLAAIIDNFISKYLRKINPKSHGGVLIQTRNLQNLSDALNNLETAIVSIDFAFNVIVREALATDAALTRLCLIEDMLNSRQKSGIHVDPVIVKALQDAKETIATSDSYYGAILMEMADRDSELRSKGLDKALQFVKENYANQALAKYYVKYSTKKIGSRAAATKASAVTGLWTWSIMLTYETIDALLDQHEKVQTAITSATLSLLIKEEIEAGRLQSSDILKAMIWQLEYMYYEQMIKVHSGLLPSYRDIVDFAIYGEKYNKEWKGYYENLATEEKTALLSLNLFDFPDVDISLKSKGSIGFIIDSSGSMQDSDPYNVRKSAASLIVDLLTGDENVFLVDFDDHSIWLNQDSWQKWNSEQLKAYISQINSNGGTNVGLGISTMRKAIEQSLIDFSNTAVVLLSDGMGSYNNEAEWFSQNGIRIYTISYKDKANAKMLSNIAISTGGVYIQANDENDVLAAFMQFNNDLQGFNKFTSYRGNFGGKSTMSIPPFFVDPGSNSMTASVSYRGNDLSCSLISPSGIQISPPLLISFNEFEINTEYLSANNRLPEFLKHNSGPSLSSEQYRYVNAIPNNNAEWKRGPGYLMVKIANAEPGQWTATISTSGNQLSNDAFLFEAAGSGGVNLPLDMNKMGGIYRFNVTNTKSEIDLKNSKAIIKLETPTGKIIDISPTYKAGSFQFYPSDGVGNYQINANILFNDDMNHTYQRQYNRSILIGELLPGYIAPVKELMGTYIVTEQGFITGNREGIKCVIYSPGQSSGDAKAIGYVTHVNERECTIKLSEIKNSKIEIGDIVELDLIQWQNDNN